MTPNSMLDDEVITRLLGEAAESFPVPDEAPGFVLEELSVATPHPRRARYLKWTAAAAAVVAAVLVVQSLGSNGPTARTQPLSAPNGDATGLARQRVNGQGTAAGTTGGGTAAGTGTTGSTWTGSAWTGAEGYSADSAPVPAAARPNAALGGAVTGRQPLSSSQTAKAPSAAAAQPDDGFADSAKIVKTGTIALIVGDGKVGGVVVKVHAIAAGAGGYVSDEKSQEYGDDPTSTLTIRVPVAKYEVVTQQVRDQVKNGVGKVDSATSSGQDVTAQYADLQAQITSLTAARDRFLAILSRANTIGETLSVQQRVDSTQLQIDRLEGQRRSLAKQSELATLTVTVGEKPQAEAKAHVQGGLSRSWDNAKHGFASGVESLISHSGRGLLVLIVAALCLVLLRSSYRLARRRLV